MNDEKINTSSDSASRQVFGVPASIVVAGGLIALAIYFGGGKTVGNTPKQDQPPAASPSVAAAGPVVPAVGNIRPVSASDHVRGSANAKVTLITYSDIECPFCKRFHPTIKQLMNEFPNDVRWVFRHFPLEQLHPNARIAANAAECASEQGKFWEILDYMMEKTTTSADLAESKLPELVKSAGLTNSAQFAACLSAKKFDQRITDDSADAATAGGRGTPHSVVIGSDGTKEAISGAQPYEAIKVVIQKYL